MGTGKISMQNKVVIGLLILWVVLLVVFGLLRSGLVSSKKVDVYFFQNTKDSSVFASVERQMKPSFKVDISEKIKFAIEQLILGPSQEEISAGYFSCVPGDARVLSVSIKDGLIYIDFSEEIESGGGISEIRGRLAQIVFTATQFNPDSGVRILIEGKEIKSFSGEGITDVEKPLYRENFTEFLQGEKNER